MTNSEKAKEIAEVNKVDYSDEDVYDIYGHVYEEDSHAECFSSALAMAEWKDEQPIAEQEGWCEEEPTEDGWYLVDTPNFPKNCRFIVAEWDNDAKRFYSEASDSPIDYTKWKLIEKR